MAEVLVVPKATYIQYRKVDGEAANEELVALGPHAVAHVLKLFASSTDDGELTLKADGGPEAGVLYLVRKNGLLFMRSRNLDEPEAVGIDALFAIFVDTAKQALLAKMQEISERLYSGRWGQAATDLEYDLFNAVIKVDSRFPEEDVAQLARLYTAADGWYCYKVGIGLVFMPGDEWRQTYTYRRNGA